MQPQCSTIAFIACRSRVIFTSAPPRNETLLRQVCVIQRSTISLDACPWWNPMLPGYHNDTFIFGGCQTSSYPRCTMRAQVGLSSTGKYCENYPVLEAGACLTFTVGLANGSTGTGGFYVGCREPPSPAPTRPPTRAPTMPTAPPTASNTAQPTMRSLTRQPTRQPTVDDGSSEYNRMREITSYFWVIFVLFFVLTLICGVAGAFNQRRQRNRAVGGVEGARQVDSWAAEVHHVNETGAVSQTRLDQCPAPAPPEQFPAAAVNFNAEQCAPLPRYSANAHDNLPPPSAPSHDVAAAQMSKSADVVASSNSCHASTAASVTEASSALEWKSPPPPEPWKPADRRHSAAGGNQETDVHELPTSYSYASEHVSSAPEWKPPPPPPPWKPEDEESAA